MVNSRSNSPDPNSRITHLPKLPAFNSNELDFEVYMNLIETNFGAYGITDVQQKKNLFLVSVGTKVFATLSNLSAPKSASEIEYEEIVKLLKGHYVTKPSYHRSLLKFQQRKKVEN